MIASGRIIGFLSLLLLLPGVVPAPAPAQNAASVDGAMARLATASPVARRARREIEREIARLRDPAVRRETRAALLDPGDCIRSRIGFGDAEQARIVAVLRARGWLDPALPPDRVRNGLFPPLMDADGPCPHAGVPALAAPGGNSGSHHSWPGGLAVHVAVNLRSGLALADGYRAVEGAAIDRDALAGAILWHDWAKSLVLRWQPDGTTAPELQVAGTGAHHILGLAEAMRRGMPPGQIVAQACAHAAPLGAGLARVQGWVDAAAAIARMEAAPYRVTATPACLISHLSDQNWILSDEAVERVDARLVAEAPSLGFDPSGDPGRYRRCLRAPVLAWLGAERLFAALARPQQARAMVREALSAAASYAPCRG